MSCQCQTCYNSCNSCTCGSYYGYGGCPLQLDAGCVIYHKDNNELSELDGLGLTNGSTLEMILEALDDKVKQLNITNFNLPTLRGLYTVNNFQQFAQAVDTQLASIKADITATLTSAVPLITTNSPSIIFSTSGLQNHTVSASVRVSAVANNLLSIESDGLSASPQNLIVNYLTKELSLTNGNTVNLSSLLSGASGFLGNSATDPAAIDGQYWYNTTVNQLKIKVNGVTKQIPLV